MKYYVYKITNNINGKWYIGKRRSKTPTTDSYMGSGRLIKEAIAKYGKDKFTKEIISIFETDDEAAQLEAILVTRDTIATNMSYNMHEGGRGGFAHLNDGSEAHRARASQAAKKNIITVKNHPNWGKSRFIKGDERTRAFSQRANLKKKLIAAQRTPEEVLAIKEKYRQIALKREANKKQTGYYANRKNHI